MFEMFVGRAVEDCKVWKDNRQRKSFRTLCQFDEGLFSTKKVLGVPINLNLYTILSLKLFFDSAQELQEVLGRNSYAMYSFFWYEGNFTYNFMQLRKKKKNNWLRNSIFLISNKKNNRSSILLNAFLVASFLFSQTRTPFFVIKYYWFSYLFPGCSFSNAFANN